VVLINRRLPRYANTSNEYRAPKGYMGMEVYETDKKSPEKAGIMDATTTFGWTVQRMQVFISGNAMD